MHPGEQVVLYLVVQAAVEEGELGPAHVGGGDDLVVQEGPAGRLVDRVQLGDARVVVADGEEEGEVPAHHGQERQQGIQQGKGAASLCQQETLFR